VYIEKYKTLGLARAREVEIKRWKREYKLAFIKKQKSFDILEGLHINKSAKMAKGNNSQRKEKKKSKKAKK